MESIQHSASGIQHSEKSSPECQMPNAECLETGGPKGPEPTRFGDWEHKGKCIDF